MASPLARRRILAAQLDGATRRLEMGASNAPAVNLHLGEGFTRVGSVEVASNVDIAEFERAT